ncbi:hypothetical protein NCS52_01557200 [Fusarium sp. LHS14.1]|nr:hypothetical protein NCS52_01557200 [Fusarium sp. LHS14.1]
MSVIKTTESFSKAARQIGLNLGNFASVQDRTGIWRMRMEQLPEKIKSLVRSYNLDKDKYCQIARELGSKGFEIEFDAGPEILWVAGPIFPKHGQLAIAIILPKPQNIQDEANTTSSTLAENVQHTEDNQQQTDLSLAVGETPRHGARIFSRSLEQKPHVEFRSLADDDQPSASETQLQPGDQPSVSETQLQPGDQPSASKTQLQPGDQPSVSETQLQPGDQPSASKTQLQPGDQPSVSETKLQPGDIVILNARECMDVKSGGVALILMRYKITKIC